MLDSLRNQASFKDDEPLEPPDSEVPELPQQRKPPRSFDQRTHMTPLQRFIVAVLLAIMVFLLGVVVLMIAGKVALPF